MALNLGELYFVANANFSQVRNETQKTENSIKNMAGAVDSFALASKAGFAIVGAAIVGVAVKSLQLAGNFEQTTKSFETLTGSFEAGNKILKELRDFASSTPFEFTQLTDAAKRMMAFGFETDKIIPMLRNIGDAVAGLGLGADGVNRVTVALGQMRSKSKVSAEEMLQLTEAGIPAWEMLASKIGVSIPKAMKLAEKGAIDADTAITAVLDGMNQKFGGLMQSQSQTLNGAMSNFNDVATERLTSVGSMLNQVFDVSGIVNWGTEALKQVNAIGDRAQIVIKEIELAQIDAEINSVKKALMNLPSNPVLKGLAGIAAKADMENEIRRLQQEREKIMKEGITPTSQFSKLWGTSNLEDQKIKDKFQTTIGGSTAKGFDLDAFVKQTQMKMTGINASQKFDLPEYVFDAIQEKYNLLSQTIQTLIENGVNPSTTALGDLIKQLNETSGAMLERQYKEEQAKQQLENNANAAFTAQFGKYDGSEISDETTKTTKSLKDFNSYLSTASDILNSFGLGLNQNNQNMANAVNMITSAMQAVSKIQQLDKSNPSDELSQSGGMVGAFFTVFNLVTSFFDEATGINRHQKEAAEAQRKLAEEWQKALSKGSIEDIEQKSKDIQQKINDLESQLNVKITQGLDFLNDDIKDSINNIYQEFNNTMSGDLRRQIEDLMKQLNEVMPEAIKTRLGIMTSDLVNSVRQAFSAETLDGFLNNFNQGMQEILRNMQIEKFLNSEKMQVLFDKLSNKMYKSIGALSDGGAELTQKEIAQIKAIEDQIYGESSSFYKVLEQLGLSMTDLSETTNQTTQAMRNLPSGFKYQLNQYSIAQPGFIPHMAIGGYVNPRPGGTAVVLGEGGEREFVTPESRMGGVYVDMRGATIYGVNDLDQRIKTAVYSANRGLSMSAAGVR